MLFLIWIMGPKTSLESSAQGYRNYFIFQVSSTFIYKGTVLLMFFVLKKNYFVLFVILLLKTYIPFCSKRKLLENQHFHHL